MRPELRPAGGSTLLAVVAKSGGLGGGADAEVDVPGAVGERVEDDGDPGVPVVAAAGEDGLGGGVGNRSKVPDERVEGAGQASPAFVAQIQHALAVALVLVIALLIVVPQIGEIVAGITRPRVAIVAVVIAAVAMLGTWACMRRTAVR